MAKGALLKLAVRAQLTAEKVAQRISESRVGRFFRWAEEEVRRGPDPSAPKWEEFKRGFLAFSGTTLKVGVVAFPVIMLGDVALANQQNDGSAGISDAFGKLEAPLKTFLCKARNIAVPILFVSGILAIIIGGILKAFQSRAAGAFLIGGVFGIAAAVVLMFVVGALSQTAIDAAGGGNNWRDWCQNVN